MTIVLDLLIMQYHSGNISILRQHEIKYDFTITIHYNFAKVFLVPQSSVTEVNNDKYFQLIIDCSEVVILIIYSIKNIFISFCCWSSCRLLNFKIVTIFKTRLIYSGNASHITVCKKHCTGKNAWLFENVILVWESEKSNFLCIFWSNFLQKKSYFLCPTGKSEKN